MGRKKLVIKPIEDKLNRQVTFSKRKAGLAKKARHLSLLCHADIAIIIFSYLGKLSEYCSGSTNSMEVMLSRYHQSQAGEGTSQGAASRNMGNKNQEIKFRTCKELLELVERVDEHPSAFSPTDIKELLEELSDALKETRSRQMDLQMEKLSNMRIQDSKLTEENEELKKQVAAARKQKGGVVDDGGEGPDACATNQSNPPKELATLPLFK